MTSKPALITQQKLQIQALAQLAIIGGQLTKDDDIRFEGKAFIFPERYRGNLRGLQKDVDRYVDGQEEAVLVEETFNYRPFDGAYATFNCLKDYFGYAQSVAKQGAFGPEPPSEITISLGYVNGQEIRETVPWGDMVLPGLPGSILSLKQQRSDQGHPVQVGGPLPQGRRGRRQRLLHRRPPVPRRALHLPRQVLQREHGVLRHRQGAARTVRLLGGCLDPGRDEHPVAAARRRRHPRRRALA